MENSNSNNSSNTFMELKRVYNDITHITRITIQLNFNDASYEMNVLIKAGQQISYDYFLNELHRLFDTNDKSRLVQNMITNIGLNVINDYEPTIWIESPTILTKHFAKLVPRYESYMPEFTQYIKSLISSCPKVENLFLINEDLYAQTMSIWYNDD